MKTVLALMLMTAPASAGQMYCNPGVPYDIAEVPHGYAVVRMAYSDFCKQDHMSDDPAYICDGRDDYRLHFDVKGDVLTLTYTDGNKATFTRCD